MSSAIRYDDAGKYIVITMKTSFYALRILSGGEVAHIASGPLPADIAGSDSPPPALLTDLDWYDVPAFGFDMQQTRWELPTYGDVTLHDVALKIAAPNPNSEIGTIRDLRLLYVGHEVTTGASPSFASPAPRRRIQSPRETLCVHLQDNSSNLQATLFYRITPEHDVIERWISISNHGTSAIKIEALSFGTVHLPNGRYELARTAGTWAGEFIKRTQNIEPGRFTMDSQGLTTGHAMNPFYMLSQLGAGTEESGTVFFGALAYSGNWSLRFEASSTESMRIHGGYEQSTFGLTLGPGETHTTPAFVHGCSNTGFGGASRRLHSFARDYVLPDGRHEENRPVLYNSWEAVYFKMSAELQMELARKAAAIGVELFCVDDGWFGGRRTEHTGLGDWHVSSDVFPQGLTPLIDEVKRLGMRFGIWVEPEMVNPDSDLYRAHPDWVLNYPARPRTEVRHQLILDFGRPEVVENIWAQLDTLLRENDISFFKWDMNRLATEPGSVAGNEIWWRHVLGLYSIMDRLLADHPSLEIQSCSGGGGRIDLGILERVDQAWTSDNTDAYDRVHIQDGFSLAYPLRAMECWVTHEKNHQTGRTATLDLRFDVAMRGALGIGTSLNELSDEELAHYARKIAFFKRIRPTMHTGDLYRLRSERGVSTWLIAAADGSQAVYSDVVTEELQGIYRAPDRLPGLQSRCLYEATDETGKLIGRWTGYQLGAVGIPPDSTNGNFGPRIRSRTILLEAIM